MDVILHGLGSSVPNNKQPSPLLVDVQLTQELRGATHTRSHGGQP